MINFIISLFIFTFIIGCNNNVKTEVPAKIENCFKNETGECTNVVIVKHIISIEVPSVFTDQCRTKYNVTDYPDPVIRESLYNQCVADYINQLTNIINSLNPNNLPVVP